LSMGPFPLLAVTAAAPVSPTRVSLVAVIVWDIITAVVAMLVVTVVGKHLGKLEERCVVYEELSVDVICVLAFIFQM